MYHPSVIHLISATFSQDIVCRRLRPSAAFNFSAVMEIGECATGRLKGQYFSSCWRHVKQLLSCKEHDNVTLCHFCEDSLLFERFSLSLSDHFGGPVGEKSLFSGVFLAFFQKKGRKAWRAFRPRKKIFSPHPPKFPADTLPPPLAHSPTPPPPSRRRVKQVQCGKLAF